MGYTTGALPSAKWSHQIDESPWAHKQHIQNGNSESKPTYLFFLLKSQIDTARTIEMPRTPARVTERMIPGEEAGNTCHIPPFSSSEPISLGYEIMSSLYSCPQNIVISPPLFSDSGLWLCGTDWLENIKGHLQIAVVFQQGFSNLYKDHLRIMFTM